MSWPRRSHVSKSSTRIGYTEAVEALLCFGWVDSKGAKLDDECSMRLCTFRVNPWR